jgi:hypothetical protein
MEGGRGCSLAGAEDFAVAVLLYGLRAKRETAATDGIGA